MNHYPPYHTPAAVVAVPQLPIGVDPESVRSRQVAMIEAGTHAMIAEKLALDAVQNQVMRERHPNFAPAKIDEPTPETLP